MTTRWDPTRRRTVLSVDRHKGWDWPSGAGQGPPTRIGRAVGFALPAMFLFYLNEPVRMVFTDPHPTAVRILVVGVVVVYAGIYLVMTVRDSMPAPPVRVLCCVVMFVCGVLLAVVFGPDDLIFMTFVIAATLTQLPTIVGLVLGVGVTVTILVGTTITDGAPNLDAASVLVVLTIALFGARRIMASNAELRTARDTIAGLAVAEERARLARDLHDVLGHSITTITVKTGLARRILESGGQVDRAIGELRDIEHLSRTVLAEVRSTVSGYREATLAAELVGARAALTAAEIDADLPHAVDNVPAELQEPFAYVLREGVTNVIRHSGADRCVVRLGESWIEVRDDGSGTATPGIGHGLTGLTERLAKVGGSIEAGPAEDGGFRLRATVPQVSEQRTDSPVGAR